MRCRWMTLGGVLDWGVLDRVVGYCNCHGLHNHPSVFLL